MPFTLKQAVDYYATLLLFEYRNNPRAAATIKIYAKQAIADMLEISVQDGFDIDTAVGAQLDIIGKYVGIPRNIGDPAPKPYYQFSDYDGTKRPNGFTDYLDPAVNAQAIWYLYQNLGSENTDLSDQAFIFMIKMKIILNSNDGTLASIMEFLHDFFPRVVALVDHADMTVTYTIAQKTPVPPSVIKAYLPKPMGVRLIFDTVSGTAPATTTKTKHTALPAPTPDSVDSDAVLAVGAGGVGPYTYQWQYVRGDPDIQASFAPGSYNPVFFLLTAVPDITKVAVWRCAVIDSRGILGYTNEVEVTLSLVYP